MSHTNYDLLFLHTVVWKIFVVLKKIVGDQIYKNLSQNFKNKSYLHRSQHVPLSVY